MPSSFLLSCLAFGFRSQLTLVNLINPAANTSKCHISLSACRKTGVSQFYPRPSDCLDLRPLVSFLLFVCLFKIPCQKHFTLCKLLAAGTATAVQRKLSKRRSDFAELNDQGVTALPVCMWCVCAHAHCKTGETRRDIPLNHVTGSPFTRPQLLYLPRNSQGNGVRRFITVLIRARQLIQFSPVKTFTTILILPYNPTIEV